MHRLAAVLLHLRHALAASMRWVSSWTSAPAVPSSCFIDLLLTLTD